MKEIALTQGKVALVDDADYPELIKYSWCAHAERDDYKKPAINRWYALRRILRHEMGFPGQIAMHRVILNPPNGLFTDHLNGNGLDNRRENLRIVNNRQNLQNIHPVKKSRYPGVSSTGKKWRAYIHLNGKQRHLGLFSDELEAATAYRVACAVLGSDNGVKIN
jgi:hypothetical protein